MITKDNLLRHELIGLQAEIVWSTDSSLVGKKGIVVDETRNTFVLEEAGDLKVIPKSNADFLFTLPDGKKVKVKGRRIVSRPEDRVKKYG